MVFIQFSDFDGLMPISDTRRTADMIILTNTDATEHMVTEQGKYCVNSDMNLKIADATTMCYKKQNCKGIKMSDYAPTISIRLPDDARERLDAATKLTKRSRSYLMKQALDRYLGDIIYDEKQRVAPTAKLGLLALEGKGARSDKPRTRADIDSHILWLRENG
jgi:hypothetical protein